MAGALFSGFAMVLTIALPLRSYYKLENLITVRHLDVIGKVLLASGLVVTYGYFMENFIAWYNGDLYERYHAVHQALGEYSLAFWAMTRDQRRVDPDLVVQTRAPQPDRAVRACDS